MHAQCVVGVGVASDWAGECAVDTVAYVGVEWCVFASVWMVCRVWLWPLLCGAKDALVEFVGAVVSGQCGCLLLCVLEL